MKKEPQNFGNPEKSATIGCLSIVEQRIELLQGCLEGKESVERPLLVDHIKQAQLRDAEMLAAIDKEIAKLKTEIKELEMQAKRFRREIDGD